MDARLECARSGEWLQTGMQDPWLVQSIYEGFCLLYMHTQASLAVTVALAPCCANTLTTLLQTLHERFACNAEHLLHAAGHPALAAISVMHCAGILRSAIRI